LQKKFKKESFNAIYSTNALDHTQDIKKCFNNIHASLIKKGFFFFQCFNNEGTRNKWKGLHKYDFKIVKGKLICHNQYKKQIDLGINPNFKMLSYNQEKKGYDKVEYKIILQKV